MANLKEKDPVALADACRRESESDMSMRLLDWTKYAEFERGNQNIYQSRKTRQVIKLYRGAYIPEQDGYFAKDYMPILNHLGVVSDAITARGNANPLKPNVRPKTSEDQDRDAAKASTLALQSYDQTLDARKDRREVVEWLKVEGNAFSKDWWDASLGDVLPPLAADTQGVDVQHLLKEDVLPKPTGDLNSAIVPSHAMIVSPGAKSMADAQYLGDMSAIDVGKALEKYGVEVKAEEGLQDLRQLQAVDTTMNGGNGALQNSARIIDLYFPPSSDHPTEEQRKYGRHIIVIGDKKVEDGVWDKEMTARYGVWHPYSKCEFLRVAGDFWGGTPYKDLCEDQGEINRQYRMAAGAKQVIRNIIAYQADSGVDTNKLRLTKQGMGLAELPYEGMQPPQILAIQSDEALYAQKIEYLKRNMDERVAASKVTRGETDPTVQSGKQQQALMQASAIQASSLAFNLAMFFRDRWQLRLRLLSVHLTQEKALRLVGEDNEVLSFSLRPEQLTSDDVEVEDLPAFLMDPETRKQQIRQNFMGGLYGDPADPAVRQKVARMLEVPFSEELDDAARDVDRARWENRQFAKGLLQETNQAILGAIAQQYDAAMREYEGMVDAGLQVVPNLPPGAPLPDLPQKPPPPIVWIQVRPWENHKAHADEHRAWMKTPEFERVSSENPDIFHAVMWHLGQHEQKLAPPMRPGVQPGMPGQPNNANPSSPSAPPPGAKSPPPSSPIRPGANPGPANPGAAI